MGNLRLGEKIMKKSIFPLIALLVFGISSTSMGDISFPEVHLNDGLSHTISDGIYGNSDVRLDQYVANTPGTHVDVVTGGDVYYLNAYHTSTVTMTGGHVAVLSALENSTINMVNGTATYLVSANYAGLSVSGGAVTDITAYDESITTLSGGSVSRNLMAVSNGIIYLEGHYFTVNGHVLENGDKLSDFVPFSASQHDYHGTITGTLADKSALNNNFRILNTGYYAGTYAGDADIVITIVPCEYALVGDIDDNCKVDLADLALMAANWMLDCYANPSDPACISK
jgi:hypothetical protein